MLAKTYALEVAGTPMRVNLVDPGRCRHRNARRRRTERKSLEAASAPGDRTADRRSLDAIGSAPANRSALRNGRRQRGRQPQIGKRPQQGASRMSGIDVVVPCYQYGRFLRDGVSSVLRQRVDRIRALIIDNASTDDTLEFASGARQTRTSALRSLRMPQPRAACELQRRNRLGARRLLHDFGRRRSARARVVVLARPPVMDRRAEPHLLSRRRTENLPSGLSPAWIRHRGAKYDWRSRTALALHKGGMRDGYNLSAADGRKANLRAEGDRLLSPELEHASTSTCGCGWRHWVRSRDKVRAGPTAPA